MFQKQQYAQLIKSKAKELGFMACGISKAAFLSDEAPKLESYLSNNYHGQMHYMANHFDKRLDPTKLVEGAKSVISLLYNYYTPETQQDPSAPVLSKYAYGKDYHYVVKYKIKELLQFINEKVGGVGGRAFVDSAPVLERAWAKRCGLGWIGKNTNLINRAHGSFFFLGELIVDIELSEDSPLDKDYCGNCTRCLDACPTGALVAARQIDGSKCISYFTIELKGSLPDDMKGRFANRMFGCDICQDVCPYNRRAKPHTEPEFEPHPQLLSITKQEWLDLKEETFSIMFQKSPVKRTKFAGLVRNVHFLYDEDSEA